jgi:uncharacterized protein (DUF305 family)
MKGSYGKFVAMIAVTTVAMFIMMYFNIYRLDHAYWSQTMAWMAIMMGAAMAIIMLSFMWAMYANRAANLAIIIIAVLVFAGALALVQSQATVGDVSYMRAMIPHHSKAIMTSERARISDPRVRKLADEIISSQQREIGEMKALIKDLEKKDD